MEKNNILIPLLLFMLLNREGMGKLSSDEIYRMTALLKSVKPYFSQPHREALSRTENVVDIVHGLSRYANNEYVKEDVYIQTVQEKNPIKLLETVRPHMRGKSRENIDKALILNDRINRLKNRTAHPQKIIEDLESITDIMEILQLEKGRELKQVLFKAKKMIEIFKT
ncbi:hypothetical protein [Geosporobacter ferrireducens]|uniref:Uncharacterized protein n=1 Tax=Geosporobacter ferrireducens TaxID=1424294 RepID=A0A1D8GKC5_9FIRM|nr:hypothetical protein [Geosporobacter ferrireducens]AOT71348.1 hypothetical protein Gferi_18390 [Geosporobacter ferrireducens]MTI57662.1 hypothetical protein [Geosporobacter ferrireducens]